MALAVDGRALGGGDGGQPPRRRSPQMRLGALSKSKSLRAGAAAQSKAQSKAVRQAGMSAAPNAVSDRLDIQQSFQSLFHDKSEEEVLNQSRFNNLAFDRDTTSDGVELIKRKIRAASYRDGGQDWDTLFLQHDRDGNGELDINEFTRALRHTAGVSRQELSDDRLRKLFDMVDADGSGEISADEFADFIKFKVRPLPLHLPPPRAAAHRCYCVRLRRAVLGAPTAEGALLCSSRRRERSSHRPEHRRCRAARRGRDDDDELRGQRDDVRREAADPAHRRALCCGVHLRAPSRAARGRIAQLEAHRTPRRG